MGFDFCFPEKGNAAKCFRHQTAADGCDGFSAKFSSLLPY